MYIEYLPHTYLEEPQYNTVMDVKDWHPDTDMNQAMMCAEKLDEEFIDYEILVSRYEKVVRIWAPSKNKWFRKCWETLDELPLAICEAVKEATK